MKEDKINSFGLFTMINSLTSASLYGIFSSYIIYKAKNASLISITIGFIFSLIISKIIYSFFIKYPNLSFSNKMKLIHKKSNKIIIIISLLASIFGYILFTYRLTTFLSTQYLIETPPIFLSILILFITYYISSKGLETTIKVSTISFFISMFIFLFDFMSLIGEVKLDNLLPIFIVSKKDIFISSITFAFYFTIPLTNLFSLNLNQIDDKNKFKKYYYLGITLSFIIAILSIFTTICLSGTKINELFDYPIYTTLKRIKLFSFLDSLENVSIMLWILFIINASSMSLLFIFNTINDTFNLTKKKNNIIKFIIMSICFTIPNFIFTNNNYNESYNYIWIPFIVLLLIFLIVIYSLIKDRFNN